VRALRFDRFGGPEVLDVTDIDDPAAGPHEAIVRIVAASVNPSDVKNVAGAMEGTVLPRTPGRDFSGVVVEGPAEWVNAEVWGTGGDIGFTRDGTHAERVALPVEALVRKPGRLSHDEASTVGVNFVVGWLGAVEAAGVTSGETICVFGASGGVGGAVAQIARVLGADVIGIDRYRPEPDAPVTDALDHFITLDSDTDVRARVRSLTGGRGADVVYDAVGGVTTAPALSALAHGGRLVVISATGPRAVEIDLIDLYHNETRILGSDSRRLTVADSAKRLEIMRPHFESGAFAPLPISATYALTDGVAAYRAVAGHARGRVVIRP
jgi:NADPH:quinone reductase